MPDNNETVESAESLSAVLKDAREQRIKSKPKRALPTERVAFVKQIEILRAYAIGSPDGTKFLTNTDISGIVGIHPNSISLCNAFFVENGLLQRGESGLAPTSDVIAYGRSFEWDQDSAPEKLGPTLQRTWFAEALLPRAALRVITETEALTVLAESASADKSYRSQLLFLIDYLEFSKLIMREGTNIRRATRLASISTGAASTSASLEVRQGPTQPDAPRAQSSNGVSFSVDINVDMIEMSGWSADRISAFFAGLAQVIAAKGASQSK